MKKLASTAGLPHEEWLRLRRQGIGGSDAAAVCDLHPYRSAFQVYLDKTTEAEGEADNESMRQGRDLEEYVARRFMEETGKKVRRANAVYYNEEQPCLLADFDRLIIGERAGLECKTVNAYSADKWKDGNIPIHYQMQCQHYLAVSGFDCWYIAALIFGREFVVRRIDRDEGLIRTLVSIEEHFWEENVQKRQAPPPDGTKEYTEELGKLYAQADREREVQLAGFEERLARREEIGALIEKLSKEKEQIDQQIKCRMQSATHAAAGGYRISWGSVESSRVDTALLKAKFPEQYSQCLRKSSYRKFTVKAA